MPGKGQLNKTENFEAITTQLELNTAENLKPYSLEILSGIFDFYPCPAVTAGLHAHPGMVSEKVKGRAGICFLTWAVMRTSAPRCQWRSHGNAVTPACLSHGGVSEEAWDGGRTSTSTSRDKEGPLGRTPSSLPMQ